MEQAAEVVVLEAQQAAPPEQLAGPQAARLEQQEGRPDLPRERRALLQVQQGTLRGMQQVEWVHLQVEWDRQPLAPWDRLGTLPTAHWAH